MTTATYSGPATWVAVLVGVALLSAIAPAVQAEAPYPIEWMRQPGTTAHDFSRDVAADHLGNVYITGYTGGSLGGPNAGGLDAFVSKYDSRGALLWSRQFGTSADDFGFDVAPDPLGNIFVSGYTGGSLGGPNAGGIDVFVRKYDSRGGLLWTRQLGTPATDVCFGAAADGLGNVLLAGCTDGDLGGPNAGYYDPFVCKYDSSGNLLWTRQLGTGASDWADAVAVDSGGDVFTSGRTRGGNLGGPPAGQDDAFVRKYDPSGNLQWTRQLGTRRDDRSYGVAADPLGNVVISGHTGGSLCGPNAGARDVFLIKHDSSGNLLWMRQLGTPADDLSFAVATDPLGNAFISGITMGNLGAPPAGDDDVFVGKYGPSGDLLWTRQLSTPNFDYAYAVATDTLGNVFVGGLTKGSLGGPNAGGLDCFLVKLTVPEPATLALLGLGGLLALRRRRRRRGRPVGGATTGRTMKRSAAVVLLCCAALATVGPSARGDTQVGDILIAQYSAGAVYHYDGATGAYQGEFVSGLASVTGLAFLPDGDLAVAQGSGDRVLRYDGDDGAYKGILFDTSISNPRGLCLAADGTLWISALSSHQVVQIDPRTGAELLRVDVGRPMGAAIYRDRLYVGTGGGAKIYEFDASTGAPHGLLSSPGATSIQSIVTAPRGELIVLTSGLSAGMLRIDREDGHIAGSIPHFAGEDLAIGNDGLVYSVYHDPAGPDYVAAVDPATLQIERQATEAGGPLGGHGLAIKPVPEPTMLVVFMFGAMGLIRRRRGRASAASARGLTCSK